MLYTRSLDIRYRTDVLVAGGGPAGVAAAVSCARALRGNGSVLLLEQSGTFGGSSTLAGVPELMNFDDGRHFLAKGFGEAVYRALYGACPMDRSWPTVRPHRLKRVYDTLMMSSGADFLFYSRVTDLIVRDGRVTHAVVSGPEGLYAVEARIVIDCTGSGAVCALAGCGYDYGDETGTAMPATLCSLWGGVDFARKGSDGAGLAQALRDGLFSQYDTVLPGIKPTFPEVGVGGGNVGHCFAVRDTDAASLTAAMTEGRRRLDEYETYYRTRVPGCENAVLMDSADYLGIRESRRIRCLKTLSEADFADQTVREDEIGRYSYPIDIHPMTADDAGMQGFGKAVSRRHADGESYGIPYGCLVPRDARNLLVAGRCIGADRAMQASVRVIPGCYITGQAAGAAAALCVRDRCDPADADVGALRALLKQLCEPSGKYEDGQHKEGQL